MPSSFARSWALSMATKSVHSVRLDAGLERRVEAHASAQGVSVSEAIRDLIEKGLAASSVDLYASPMADLVRRVMQSEFSLLRISLDEHTKDMEERVAKVCSRGSRAALANLVQIVDLSRALIPSYQSNTDVEIFDYYKEIGGQLLHGDRLEKIRPIQQESHQTGSSSWNEEV